MLNITTYMKFFYYHIFGGSFIFLFVLWLSLHIGDVKNEAALHFFLGKRVLNSKALLPFSLTPAVSLGKFSLRASNPL